MGRPRKDGTPAQSNGEVSAKPVLSPDTVILNHLYAAYNQADGVLATADGATDVQQYLTIATTTAELVSYMRPQLRQWAIIAAGNRAQLDALESTPK